MGRESEILAGLLAVQMRLVPGPQFARVAAMADADPSKTLTKRLVEEGAIGAAEMASIRTLADAHVRHHEGDEARALATAPIDPKILDSLDQHSLSPLLRETLRGLRPAERFGTTVLSKFSTGLSLLASVRSEPEPAKPAAAEAASPPVPRPAPVADAVAAAQVAQDERRAERALRLFAECLDEVTAQHEFRARALTRGVAEPHVSALSSDRADTVKISRQATTLFEQCQRTLDELLRRRPSDPVILRSAVEFFRLAGDHWEVEGNADRAAMLLERAKHLEDGHVESRHREAVLNLRTRAFPCRCVLEGRRFPADSLVLRGFNLATGAPARHAPAALHRPEPPSGEWHRFRAHAPECQPQPLPGAHVWLFRYDLHGDFCCVGTPADVPSRADTPLPPVVVSALFGEHSPHSPSGPGVYLGTTPVENVSLPPGSWMLVVWKPERVPLRVPVRTGPSGTVDLDLTLSLPAEIPARFAFVPEGRFLYQGDLKNPHSEPLQSAWTQDFLLDRSPVTSREYCEFLNDLTRTEMDFVAKRHGPRAEESGLPYWPGPPFRVPTADMLSRAAPEIRALCRRMPGCQRDWQEDWPVVAVSWRDALAYAAYRSAKTGWLFSIPHEIEWEKAARGADGRAFPWGNVHLRGACNTISVRSEGASPGPVWEFPADESPYGVLGMGGNTRDWCLNEPGSEFTGERVMRGGHWGSDGLRCHASYRSCAGEDHVSPNGGIRLMCLTRIAARPRLGPPESEIRHGGA